MKQERQAKVGRRDFLRAMGAGASAAVAGAGPLAGQARADTETDEEKRKPRYRETEDVKNYYRVNRYPK
jgi:anaerobic selenocysteine-containing dehydrogenase